MHHFVCVLLFMATVAMAQEHQAPPPAPIDLPQVGKTAAGGFRFGPYARFVESREQEALSRTVKKMLHDLQDVFYACKTCAGGGTIEVIVREGYQVDECTWAPPVVETRTCPSCEGAKSLFNRDVGVRVFRRLTPATSDDDAYVEAQARWLKTLHGSRSSLARAPRYSIVIDGRNATVRGGGGPPLYPIRFRLAPAGKRYRWALHDAVLHGLFRPDSDVAATGRVRDVAAADIYVLESDVVVRLCGVYVPGADGKPPPPDLPKANEAARKLVRAELKGKIVRVERDPRASITCDGHPLVYVVIDGKDYGAELLRRGVVRRHPGHKHARSHAYMKTETAAKTAEVGIWK